MNKQNLTYSNRIIDNVADGYVYSVNTTTGSDFDSHTHECYELIHVLKGALTYTVEGESYMIYGGDLVVTNPGERHSFSFPEQGEYSREFLHIYPGFLAKFPELIKALNSRKSGFFNRIPAKTVKAYGIDEIFDRMEKVCTEKPPETDCFMLLYSAELLLRLKQVFRNELPEKQQITTKKKSKDIIDFINAHYTEDINTADITSALFMSPSYANRLFKNEINMTIKAYLNMRRVRRAKNLIMEGCKPMNIYMRCGFKDYSTFYRSFVKYVGMTPDEFKHRHDERG